ncbi:unnamed protein product [Paramecium sonneborni]|uniref:40S ribosomal protein S21 n=1 Tax=Paramecium sonneborni TaxID=65129 RepID=A0A8S1R4K4_9CILI|nr:unnamed protein product [Paramecium sonneborni]
MAHRIQENAGMINDEKQVVDIYVPRKCQYTNMILNSSDYSSVQINVGQVDENGVYNKNNSTVILAGYLRQKGQSASALEAILRQRGIFPFTQ